MPPFIRKTISIGILITFLVTSVQSPAMAQSAGSPTPWMPAPGTMVHLSPPVIPAHIQGITIHPENPFEFDFIIDQGEEPLDSDQKKQEYKKLIKYFLASLTIPEKDLWVNLSPYENNRIIPDNFGKTDMGREILGQDYLLKQITASLIYPEEQLGKQFWNEVYKRAYKELGTTNIPINTFNKVWIIPDQAEVYENGSTAFILRSHLKVLLEEDYEALNKNNQKAESPKGISIEKDTHTLGSQIVRQIILPVLEKEVNEGKNFALLRQINSSLILATWFKKRLKESILTKIYVDKAKVKGVDQPACRQAGIPCEPNEEIYQQYLKAYKKGVYNFIKEDFDQYSQQIIPRKYFSGGWSASKDGQTDFAATVHITTKANLSLEDRSVLRAAKFGRFDNASVALNSTSFARSETPDAAMKSRLSIPKASPIPAEWQERHRNTVEANKRYQTGANVTAIVIAKHKDGRLLFLRQADGRLALPERYALGGEDAFGVALAALDEKSKGSSLREPTVIAFETQVDRGVEQESRTPQSPMPYQYSVVVSGEFTGRIGRKMVALNAQEIALADIIPEHRDIVRKYRESVDMMARNPAEQIPAYKLDPKRGQATQDIQDRLLEKGTPIGIAPDVIAERYDQNGQFLGIVIIRRKVDGHWATPGGFARRGESVEKAALREFREEAGLKGRIQRMLRFASRPDRDDRQFIWSPLYLAKVFDGKEMASAGEKNDTDKVEVFFKDRHDFENFLLDKDRWVLAKDTDELSTEENDFLDGITAQRDRDGRISKENYQRLQRFMEERRRSGKYGLLWADHLEHFKTYFDYKEFSNDASVDLDTGELRMSDVVRELKGLTADMNAEEIEEDQRKLIDRQRVEIAQKFIEKFLEEKTVHGRTQGSAALTKTIIAILNSDKPGLREAILSGKLFLEAIKQFNLILQKQRSMVDVLVHGVKPEARVREKGEQEQRLINLFQEIVESTGKQRSPIYEPSPYGKELQEDWIGGRRGDQRFIGELKTEEVERADIADVLKQVKGSEPNLIQLINMIIEMAKVGRNVLDFSWRTKGLDSTFAKIQKFRDYNKKSPRPGPLVSLANLTDLWGGRIVVDDLLTLEKLMVQIEEMIKDQGDSSPFKGMRILRKENYYINGPLKGDPYRGIQYTITMPGEDGKLLSFELQLNTIRASFAADIAHDAIYKPQILNLPDAFQWVVREYCLDTNIEEAEAYVRAKGWSSEDRELTLGERIQIAINESDINAFYDLVLSHLEEYYQSKANWEQAYDWISAFHNKFKERLQGFLDSNPEQARNLAKSAHDLGYYYVSGVAGGRENKDGRIFNSDMPDLNPALLKEALRRNPYLLTERGLRYVANVYETYDGGGTSHKITPRQLDLPSLSRVQLEEFFRALGKNPQAVKVKEKIDQILAGEGLDKEIINLFKEPFEDLEKIGHQIVNETARNAWLKRIVDNNIDSLIPAIVFSEVGGVDQDGHVRDVSQPAFNGSPHSIREMLTRGWWVFAQQWDGKGGYEKNYLTRPDYKTYSTSDDENIKSKIDLDRSLDTATNSALTRVLLSEIRKEETNIFSNEKVDRHKLAYLQRLKSEYLVKLIRSIAYNWKNGSAHFDFRNIAERLSGLIDSWLQEDADWLIQDSGGYANLVMTRLKTPVLESDIHQIWNPQNFQENSSARKIVEDLSGVLQEAGLSIERLRTLLALVDRAMLNIQRDWPVLAAVEKIDKGDWQMPAALQESLEDVIRQLKGQENFTTDDEAVFRLAAQGAAYAHRNQTRDGEGLYITHPFDVALRNRVIFHNKGAIFDFLSLWHDVLEDQRDFYRLVERTLASTDNNVMLAQFHLGMWMLSLDYEHESDYKARFDKYYRGLNDPKEAGYPINPVDDWYNDDFIRRVSLIKLSDLLANLEDLTETVKHKGVSSVIRYVNNIRDFAFSGFVFKSRFLTGEDRKIFAAEVHRIMNNYLAQGWNENDQLRAIAQGMKEDFTSRGYPDLVQLGQGLKVVQQIGTALNKDGFTIIFGGPGTGKTEQTETAIGNRGHTFDLREEFAKVRAKALGIPERDYKYYRYQTADEKLLQEQWLDDDKLEEMYQEILAQTNEQTVILVDEFDFAIGDTLNSSEQQAAIQILKLAHRLMHGEGKNKRKIILILHVEALHMDSFRQEIKRLFLKADEEVEDKLIQMEYLSTQTEQGFLKGAGLDDGNIAKFMALVQGVPAAYMGFLKHLAEHSKNPQSNSAYRPSFEELIEGAKKILKANYRSLIASGKGKDMAGLFNEIARNPQAIDRSEVQSNRTKLLETGLVGERDGRILMPQIVKQVIRDSAMRTNSVEREQLGQILDAAMINDTEQSDAPTSAYQILITNRTQLHTSYASLLKEQKISMADFELARLKDIVEAAGQYYLAKNNNGRRLWKLKEKGNRGVFIKTHETLAEALENNGFYNTEFFELLIKRSLGERLKAIDIATGESEHFMTVDITPDADTRTFMKGVINKVLEKFRAGEIEWPELGLNKFKRFVLKTNSSLTPRFSREVLAYVAISGSVLALTHLGMHKGLIPVTEEWKLSMPEILILYYFNRFIFDRIEHRFVKKSARSFEDFNESALLERIMDLTPKSKQKYAQDYSASFKRFREYFNKNVGSSSYQKDFNETTLLTLEIIIRTGLQKMERYRRTGMNVQHMMDIIEEWVSLEQERIGFKDGINVQPIISMNTVIILILKELNDQNPQYLQSLKNKWQVEQRQQDASWESKTKDIHSRPQIQADIFLNALKHVELMANKLNTVLRRKIAEEFKREEGLEHDRIILAESKEDDFLAKLKDSGEYDGDYLAELIREIKKAEFTPEDRKSIIISRFFIGTYSRLRQLGDRNAEDKHLPEGYAKRVVTSTDHIIEILEKIKGESLSYGLRGDHLQFMITKLRQEKDKIKGLLSIDSAMSIRANSAENIIIQAVEGKQILSNSGVQELLWEYLVTRDVFVVLTGGAAKMLPEDQQRVLSLMDALGLLTEGPQGMKVGVGDGGTNEGIMEAVGKLKARLLAEGKDPDILRLLGVAPHGKVAFSQAELDENRAAKKEAEKRGEKYESKYWAAFNHDTITVSDGGKPGVFGSETGPLFAAVQQVAGTFEGNVPKAHSVFKAIGDRVPSLSLLINGGPVTLKEVQENINQKRRVIVIKGSGRAADVVAMILEGRSDEEMRTHFEEALKLKIAAGVIKVEKQESERAEYEKLITTARGMNFDKDLFEIFDLQKEGEHAAESLAYRIKENVKVIKDNMRLNRYNFLPPNFDFNKLPNPQLRDEHTFRAWVDRLGFYMAHVEEVGAGSLTGIVTFYSDGSHQLVISSKDRTYQTVSFDAQGHLLSAAQPEGSSVGLGEFFDMPSEDSTNKGVWVLRNGVGIHLYPQGSIVPKPAKTLTISCSVEISDSRQRDFKILGVMLGSSQESANDFNLGPVNPLAPHFAVADANTNYDFIDAERFDQLQKAVVKLKEKFQAVRDVLKGNFNLDAQIAAGERILVLEGGEPVGEVAIDETAVPILTLYKPSAISNQLAGINQQLSVLINAGADNAMGAVLKKGGIDLNPANQNLVIRGSKGNMMSLIQSRGLDNIHIEGLEPEIMEIKPVTNLYKILGMNEV